MGLATRDECRSRLALRQGHGWQLLHGPFTRRELRALPSRGWALLVQDINLVLPSAQELLMQFNFIPYARQDDLMVSLAPDGAGVGPHFDSYDVFLLQGLGKRRWDLSRQRDLALIEDAPLRILKNFKPTQSHTLNPGDMLYLPPHVAHNGVAIGECMTYSVGFRSPSLQELVSGFLAHLEDQSMIQGMYADADLAPATSPARVPPAMLRATLAQLRKLDLSRSNVAIYLGCYLTQPQSQVAFDPPDSTLTLSRFKAAVTHRGIVLDLRTRMLWSEQGVFINGEHLAIAEADAFLFRELADHRRLKPRGTTSRNLCKVLHEWYRAGYLHCAG